jgi:hypothetical protein
MKTKWSGTKAIKESPRSEELRAELRKQGYNVVWDVREDMTRISYWHNGCGKVILVMEHAIDMQWQGWDIFGQLCRDNNSAKTFEALAGFTMGVEVGA